MFDRLGKLVSRYFAVVIGAWLVLAIALHVVSPRWAQVAHDGDLAYLPDRMPSVEGERLLSKAFPERRAKSQIAIVIERPQGALTGDDYQWADDVADRFGRLTDELKIVDIWTRRSEIVGDKLLSPRGEHGQAAVIVLHLANEFMATNNIRVLARVESELAKIRGGAPPGAQVGITGSAAIGGDMLSSAAESIRNTEWTTIGLVIVILMLVYRAPLLVMIPLLTIGVALSVATDLLALLTQLGHVQGFEWWHFKVFTTTRIFIIVILFGAGTDFCLFLISRFQEELAAGRRRAEAVAASVGNVGHALVGSALTTIFGLGMMFFADFGKFRNSGPALAVALSVTLIACLTLAPALLQALGGSVFWPLAAGGEGAQSRRSANLLGGFWEWIAGIIIARPGLILTASVLVMTPLAWQGLSTKITYDFLNELDPARPSVRGTQMAKRHLPKGELTPVTVLALSPDGVFDTARGERQIARLTKLLYDLKGVNSVRSVAEPLGNKPGYFQPLRSQGLKKLAARKHHRTEATFLTQVPGLVGKVARFDLVLDEDPFSLEAIEILDHIDARLLELSADRTSPWNGTRFSFAGTTAGIRDLKYVTASDQTLIERLVVLSVLAVLLVIVRRPLVCVYLVASVLFSYYVTIGATEMFFSWLYGDTFYGLDWKVPIFLFVILIAVGEDYNIYLVTRVLEEQRRHGPLEGLRIAVVRTGGIITSCGVIMAGTFISMMASTLRGMLELGFALSLGVMLDTCIVRPILVPAFLALVHRFESALRRRDETPRADHRLGVVGDFEGKKISA